MTAPTVPTPPATRAEQQAALDAAYAHCAAINAEHGKSYHLATRLLTPDRRPAVHALYAAARTADDIVDVGADLPGREPEAELAEWSRAALTEIEAGWSDDPVRLAMVHTVRRYRIPLEHVVDFLAAMTSDLDVTGYADMAALDRYMWGSASVIGLQVLPVLGTAPGVTREEAAPHAIALGEAFQLTNFLRDVAEDVDRGRVYIPADVMAAHGVTREQLAEKRHDQRFRAMMQEMVDVVRRRYDDAAPGTPMLAPESRDCVRAATDLYGGILTEIERADYRVLERRVRVSRPRRVAVFARRLTGAQLARARLRVTSPSRR
ncbi:phytoene/squalene synthase family protein [Modestobacter sp. I12A-02628]|uniref:Phytoene/squalene synthase family protein n=1 Tax=Goekera deserti TaxID=2497753 RepID=A0A7K3WCG6_9ACTN|nr:phytoene/squalene synthase family protein [Goekera deserti]MPQ97684.1 phytoene/squalene synthase family protein [Goekera deserti]NDI47649.1 squalene/phytoene synthase family protein [Goekera deserti]NDI47712.1 squalene/phytoene synthase family protein [Goekera deserti]NEL53460.1 phytoene/squalene synthase family protein [Goekera deserti]